MGILEASWSCWSWQSFFNKDGSTKLCFQVPISLIDSEEVQMLVIREAWRTSNNSYDRHLIVESDSKDCDRSGVSTFK